MILRRLRIPSRTAALTSPLGPRPRRSPLARVLVLVTAAVALLWLAGIVFGFKVVVLESGSMSPEIPAGALGITHTVTADHLRRGDVVSVIDPSGASVTHRIESISTGDAGTALLLKGDANPTADPQPVILHEADLMLFHVAGLGYAAGWLAGPGAIMIGLIALGILVVWACLVAVRMITARHPGSSSTGLPGRHLLTAGIALVIAAMLFQSLTPIGTQGKWRETATATSGSLSVAVIPPPTALKCVSNLLNPQLTWSGTASTYDLELSSTSDFATVTVYQGVTSPYSLSGILDPLLAVRWARVRAVQTFPQTRWSSAPSAAVRYNALAGLCL